MTNMKTNDVSIDSSLATFVLEAKRKNSDFYPGNTLKNLLVALFRPIKGNLGPLNVVNFIDKSEQEAHASTVL